MFKSFELGTDIEVPELPYPYNRAMSPLQQRFHWVMARLSTAARPQIIAIVRKMGHIDSLDGHEFIMAIPTADPGYELAYFCVDRMSNEFRVALQAIQQSDQEL